MPINGNIRITLCVAIEGNFGRKGLECVLVLRPRLVTKRLRLLSTSEVWQSRGRTDELTYLREWGKIGAKSFNLSAPRRLSASRLEFGILGERCPRSSRCQNPQGKPDPYNDPHNRPS